jgi:hypothetical protein
MGRIAPTATVSLDFVRSFILNRCGWTPIFNYLRDGLSHQGSIICVMQEASSPEEEAELAFAQLQRLLWLSEANPEAYKRELKMMYPGEESPQ